MSFANGNTPVLHERIESLFRLDIHYIQWIWLFVHSQKLFRSLTTTHLHLSWCKPLQTLLSHLFTLVLLYSNRFPASDPFYKGKPSTVQKCTRKTLISSSSSAHNFLFWKVYKVAKEILVLKCSVYTLLSYFSSKPGFLHSTLTWHLRDCDLWLCPEPSRVVVQFQVQFYLDLPCLLTEIVVVCVNKSWVVFDCGELMCVVGTVTLEATLVSLIFTVQNQHSCWSEG